MKIFLLILIVGIVALFMYVRSKNMRERKRVLTDLRNRNGGQESRSNEELLDHLRNQGNISQPPSPPPPPPKKIVISVKSEADWQNIMNKINNFAAIDEFLAKTEFNSLSVALSKAKKDAAGFKTPAEIDEQASEKAVKNIEKIAERFLGIFEEISKTNYDKHREAKHIITAYLENLGVEFLNFKEGDYYEDWADLGMRPNIIKTFTSDKNLLGKLAKIRVQPLKITYIDQYEDESERVFGGRANLYAEKEA